MKKWLHNFIGRKLAAFLGTALLIAVNKALGSPLTDADVAKIVAAMIAYIVGQAASDVAGKVGG